MKKLFILLIGPLMFFSCDEFLWQFESSLYSQPTYSYDVNFYELQANWDSGLTTFSFGEYHYNSINSLDGIPNAIISAGFSSIFDYFTLLFNEQVDITADAIVTTESDEYNDDPSVVRTITVQQVPTYNLPKATPFAIDGSESLVQLSGDLNVMTFQMSSTESFYNGTAVCVFSQSTPAGLLYIYYVHDQGYASLIYARDVGPIESGDYFPMGNYVYNWSIYETD